MPQKETQMAEKKGCQTPTQSVILDFSKSYGSEAKKYYEESGRKLITWQARLVRNIMGTDKTGLWVHQKFGFSVPRRNGKNEIIAVRELWGLLNGEIICHTAHRISTSRTAWLRLCRILEDAGYKELGRPKKGEKPPEKSYKSIKQNGMEGIELTGGGRIVFRTRSASGGLGEGFDLLVIDEAQEYTTDQESALIYTVSDSMNPQTLFCGTPPTVTSSGTVFPKMREDALAGNTFETGWAEWSIPDMTEDIYNKALWYKTNPSMGYHLDERKIRSEIRGDLLDFNIQRLGVWVKYNLKSAISAGEWEKLKVDSVPALKGKLFIGIKFGKDGRNAALSAAVKTKDGHIFVECLACRPMREGNIWIVELLKRLDTEKTAVDGANGQQLLAEAMKDAKLKTPMLPTVREVITAYSAFEQGVFSGTICHKGQKGLANIAGNCDKRNIGSSGGWGYKALRDEDEIAILDSAVFAYWLCSEAKDKKKQKISY